MSTDATPADAMHLLDVLAEQARTHGDTAVPFAQGTFAIYATPEGGIVLATSVEDGIMTGTHHHVIPAAMIRAIFAFIGGNKVKAVKGLFSRKKAISDR